MYVACAFHAGQGKVIIIKKEYIRDIVSPVLIFARMQLNITLYVHCMP